MTCITSLRKTRNNLRNHTGGHGVPTGERKEDQDRPAGYGAYRADVEARGIYIPSREEEAVRDFIRGRGNLADDLTRTKQRMQKFLLRHGCRYESGRYWTGLHIKWMRGLGFEQTLEKETFEQYLSRLEDLK